MEDENMAVITAFAHNLVNDECIHVLFPCGPEEVDAALRNIGARIGDFYHADTEWTYESPVEGLGELLNYATGGVDVNELARVVSELDDDDVVSALCDEVGSAEELLQYLRNGEYTFLRAVFNDKDLGEEVFDNFGLAESIPAHLVSYFDFEKFGRDHRIVQGGTFCKQGYIALN